MMIKMTMITKDYDHGHHCGVGDNVDDHDHDEVDDD